MSDEKPQERGPRGYFAPGNTIGSRPKNNSMRKLNAMLREATSEEDLLAVWRAVVDEAKAGSYRHQQMVLDRLCGKPQQFVELSSGETQKLFSLAMADDVEKA